MELKVEQLKEELKSLKLKDKTQEIQISDLNSQYSSKIRQMSFDFERKQNELNSALKNLQEKYSETLESKQFLEEKLAKLEKAHKETVTKYQG